MASYEGVPIRRLPPGASARRKPVEEETAPKPEPLTSEEIWAYIEWKAAEIKKVPWQQRNNPYPPK